MRHWLGYVLFVALTLLTLPAANADVLTLNFSGTINVVTNPNSVAAVGDKFAGTFYLDTETPLNPTTAPNVANHMNAVISASASITHGSVTSSVSGPTVFSYFEVDNNVHNPTAAVDFVNVGVLGLLGPSTSSSSALFLNLGDSTATVFSNLNFPTSLDLASFDFHRFQIDFDRFQVFGNVESLTLASVPEPTTLVLLGVALAGVGFSRRKRTAN